MWIDFTILNLQKGNILSKFVLNFQLHNAMDNTLILSPDGKVLEGVRDESITSVIVPDGVTEIGWGAFEGCTSLTSIDIPNSVTKIGHGAFKGCTSLTSIDIPDSVTEIGDGAFLRCTSLKKIVVSPDNPIFYVRDGVLYEKINEHQTKLKYVTTACSKKRLDENVSIIAEHAFSDAKGLEIIVLDGVMKIERNAFCHHESCCCSAIKEIHCRTKEEIEKMDISETAFNEYFYNNCVLYVPSGTRWSYRHHPVWGKFKNIEIEKL